MSKFHAKMKKEIRQLKIDTIALKKARAELMKLYEAEMEELRGHWLI